MIYLWLVLPFFCLNINGDPNFGTMRIKELKQRLSDYGAACRGCTAKKDFVDLLTKIAANPDLAKKYPAKKSKSKRQEPIPDALIEGTQENFNEVVLESTVPVMVEFFSPHCGHCKNLEPHWKAAAGRLAPKVKLVAVDATIESELASKHDIRGYPTIKVYMPGEGFRDYGGGREEDRIVEYGLSLIGEQLPKVEESEVSLDPNELVKSLETVPKALVAFTSHSCGKPCDRVRKNFMKVIKRQRKNDPNPDHALLFLVDCTPGGCEELGVQDYPNVLYYEKAKRVAVYEHTTSTVKLLGFAKRPSKENAQLPPPEKWGIEGEEIVPILTSVNFKSFLKSHPRTLVFFYAPWCGHCNTAKPKVVEAAQALSEKGDDDVDTIAAVDCTAHQSLCSKYKVTGYPNFIYFKNGKKVKMYNGDRTAEGFLSFLADPDKKEIVKQDPFLDSGDDDHEVNILGQDTMKSFLSDHQSVLVMFYAPWCGHCKNAKPAYAEAAEELKESEHSLAAIDCTVHRDLCQEYDVGGYPTIKYFSKGKPKNYDGGRDKDSFVSFMTSQKVAAEKSSRGETPDESDHDEL